MQNSKKGIGKRVLRGRAGAGRHPPGLWVGGLSRANSRGWVGQGSSRFLCALGRSGRQILKREGDGATPLGCYRLRQVYYRADRLRRPQTSLPVRNLRPEDGWCDAIGDRNYNRHVRHPYPASAEMLWRDDALYDLIVVLDQNERPRVRGGGSAIFLHIARDGFRPTAGCVALSRRDLLLLLQHAGPKTRIRVVR